MGYFVDINSDLGEGFGMYTMADDEKLLKEISSANIACGFHAGDPRIMNLTVQNAIENNVGIGAHPSFPDLNGFGRRDMNLTPLEIETDVLYQLGALNAFVKKFNTSLQHISPHGKLGNMAVKNSQYAEAIIKAVKEFDSNLIIMTEPGELANIAQYYGLKVAIQMFADRAYNDDGTLVSRNEINSVIIDSDEVVNRCLQMVLENKVKTINNTYIDVNGHTLCIHGDTDNSIELVMKIKKALTKNGIVIKKLKEWL